MASKRRRSASLSPAPILQCSLDVRFQKETEKEAFIARITRVRDLLDRQKKETKWTTMRSVCCSLLLTLYYSHSRVRVLSYY